MKYQYFLITGNLREVFSVLLKHFVSTVFYKNITNINISPLSSKYFYSILGNISRKKSITEELFYKISIILCEKKKFAI